MRAASGTEIRRRGMDVEESAFEGERDCEEGCEGDTECVCVCVCVRETKWA